MAGTCIKTPFLGSIAFLCAFAQKPFKIPVLMRRYSYLLLPLLLLAFAACEKEVNIKLDTGAPKVVVDGFIETGLPPVIVLTNSFSYFSKIDLSTLENAFIHDAHITVSNGMQEITLREYMLDTGINSNRYYFYSVDTADPTSFSFTGQPETFYTLKVTTGGKTYESVTKIPAVKPLDSIWYELPPRPVPDLPTAVNVFVRYSDPDTLGNSIRYFTSRNGSLFLPPFNSVYNDDIVNGTSFNIGMAPGAVRTKDINIDSLSHFFKGDSIVVKWCAIDKASYDFWNTMEFSVGTVGNPFSSPVTVMSNIKGGALGIWCGYGTSYKTLVIPE